MGRKGKKNNFVYY
ncbi:hypothetical protein F383_02414 [Gossypium arboreum]|uniref:Uncharacterized protein n=1 Tax=Gossypium arboreum TaxID=29729 RepID=A0A0B0NMB9_GOSAR|nr:hypothetical protein F383_02414 [Gossypium arboreum]